MAMKTKDLVKAAPALAGPRWDGGREDRRKNGPKKNMPSPDWRESPLPEKNHQLHRELHVHQIELEMQKDELRRMQAAMDAERMQYRDLNDLNDLNDRAPLGYFTVSEQGIDAGSAVAFSVAFGTGGTAVPERPA